MNNISKNHWRYLGTPDVLLARVDKVVEELDHGRQLDQELYADIMESIEARVADEVGQSHESGVFLYYEIMLRAIKRPFDLIAPFMKYACEGVPACTWAGFLQGDLQKWVEAVQEFRFGNDLGDYTTIMQGLGQLLGQQQPTLITVLGHWNSTKKGHVDFDDVMRALETTAAASKQKADLAPRGKGRQQSTSKGRGRENNRLRAGRSAAAQAQGAGCCSTQGHGAGAAAM